MYYNKNQIVAVDKAQRVDPVTKETFYMVVFLVGQDRKYKLFDSEQARDMFLGDLVSDQCMWIELSE